ncbi:MAG: hypothetical protein V3T84_08595 [Phycisphaerales bacterium]
MPQQDLSVDAGQQETNQAGQAEADEGKGVKGCAMIADAQSAL